jgi:hypothetical protein
VLFDLGLVLAAPAAAQGCGLLRTDWGSWCGGKGGWQWPQAAVAGPELQRSPHWRGLITEGSGALELAAQLGITNVPPSRRRRCGGLVPTAARTHGAAVLRPCPARSPRGCRRRSPAWVLRSSRTLGPGAGGVLGPPAVMAPPIELHSPKAPPAAFLMLGAAPHRRGCWISPVERADGSWQCCCAWLRKKCSLRSWGSPQTAVHGSSSCQEAQAPPTAGRRKPEAKEPPARASQNVDAGLGAKHPLLIGSQDKGLLAGTYCGWALMCTSRSRKSTRSSLPAASIRCTRMMGSGIAALLRCGWREA